MNHEPAQAHLVQAHWRKSSYSQGQSDCVEVADANAWAGVRDSKNPGPMLVFTTLQWQAFLQTSLR